MSIKVNNSKFTFLAIKTIIFFGLCMLSVSALKLYFPIDVEEGPCFDAYRNEIKDIVCHHEKHSPQYYLLTVFELAAIFLPSFYFIERFLKMMTENW